MKITQEKSKEFLPINIKLESQQEVDELFALLNHMSIADVVPNISRYSEELDKYSTDAGYKAVHLQLCLVTK